MWANPKTRGSLPPGVLCDVCGHRIDYNAINPNYKPPRSYYDLCAVYDGDFLVSPRMREWLEAQHLSGLRFVELASSRRYFVLQSLNIVKLVRTPSLKLEEFCSACRQYKSVWGTSRDGDSFEGMAKPLRYGICFSDIRVGAGPNMRPLMILGVETWQAMSAQKFKGTIGIEPIIN